MCGGGGGAAGPRWYHFPSVPLPPRKRQQQPPNRWGGEEEEDEGEEEIFSTTTLHLRATASGKTISAEKRSSVRFSLTTECQWFLSGERLTTCRECSVCSWSVCYTKIAFSSITSKQPPQILPPLLHCWSGRLSHKHELLIGDETVSDVQTLRISFLKKNLLSFSPDWQMFLSVVRMKMRLRHWSAALGAKLPNTRPSIPSICSGTTSASCWGITKLFSLNDSLRFRLFSFMRAWQFDRCYVTDSCWDSRRLQKSGSRFCFCPYWRKKKKPNRWINSPKFLQNFKVCWRE